MRTVYMDHSATTYVRDEVLDEMLPYFSQRYGNPSSIHHAGRATRQVLDDCRERIAKVFRIKPGEIIFTSGGSEADNLAIKGRAWALKNKGDHIITSTIEHHAVLHSVQWLETQGFKATYLPVDHYGLVSPDDLDKAITDKTILATVMASNNEVGTIQDTAALSAVCAKRGVAFHTDAVQSIGYYDLGLDQHPIDMLSLSAHKFYGPKGVGMLFVRSGTKIEPLIHGGAQERHLRAGTENIAGIVGLTKALELANDEMPVIVPRLTAMRDRLISSLMKTIPNTGLNGHPTRRLPHNANLYFSRIEGEGILLQLDMSGICASSGSACTSGSLQPSHVLSAMGLDPVLIHGSVRFTLGHRTTDEDIDYLLEKLPPIVEKLRLMSAIPA
jgi:cysteine desulfurase